jgi:hypothetical protein
MNDLSIGRLTATVADWPDPALVPRMLQGVADDRLEDAVRRNPLPDGEWCVRRVDLDLRLDPGRPSGALESDWADQIVIALRQSLRDGARDVVHYERPEEALDDLLSGLATGDHERAWAWRQVGVLAIGDPEPGEAPRELCVRVLDRWPYGVAAALARLVRRTGPAAVHRLLGVAGWTRVAELAAREAGTTLPRLVATAAPGSDAAPTGAVPDAVSTAASNTPAPAGTPGLPRDVGSTRLGVAVVDASTLAGALRGSGLRADQATLLVWAVLVLAGTDPAALRRPDAPAVVLAVAELLRPAAGKGLATARVSRRRHTEPPGRRAAARRADPEGSSGPPADVTAEAVGSPEGEAEPGAAAVGADTAWGGLLYLLNTAADAGLPDALEEPPFLGRPVPWVVQQLGVRLVPAPSDDPAVLALSGLDPELSGDDAPPDEQEAAALDQHAARWCAATAARLRSSPADPTSDVDVVRRMACRDALVVREPGWIEVHLGLEDVDLDVRRAGLDIDPGWVWWLGHVVRFRYE